MDGRELQVIAPEGEPGAVNERCPLQARCERKCLYHGHELDCAYYAENAGGEYVIPDQEAVRSIMAEQNQRVDSVPRTDVSPVRMIPADCLYPHPNNPRKDVGDVSELAENMKANGVLQNLTVVPAMLVQSVWEEINRLPSEDVPPEAYVVVIGHRRLAAAKLAGIADLPCVVSNMTPDKQLAVMLGENIQRKALSNYEEVVGFQQLRMDFGKSVQEIADMYGFSTTTVRTRLKLAKLDGKKVQAAEERGATLADYMELDKIEDLKTRDKVLEKIGTPNFQNELAKAVQREKAEKITAAYEGVLSGFAKKIAKADWSLMEYVKSYRVHVEKPDEVVKPDDADQCTYYYIVSSYDISLYRDKQEHQETPEEIRKKERQAEAERLKKQLEEITERHFNLRKKFICGFLCAKKHTPCVVRYAADALLQNSDTSDASLLSEVLGITADNEMEVNEIFESVETISQHLGIIGKSRSEVWILLCVAYAATDGRANKYWTWRWNGDRAMYEYPHEANSDLDRLYQFLVELGYEMSEEEKQMQNGTHPLFQTGENGGNSAETGETEDE